MRFSTTLAVVAAVASSTTMAITCGNPISSGILHIVKNGAEKIPLTFRQDGAAGWSLISSPDGSQDSVSIVPCNSTFIGAPGTKVNGSTVTVSGKITAHGWCLTREPTTGQLKLGACAGGEDAGLLDQFFGVDLVYHEGDEATGSDRPLKFKKTGVYDHLAGGLVYGEFAVMNFLRSHADSAIRNDGEASQHLAAHILLHRVKTWNMHGRFYDEVPQVHDADTLIDVQNNVYTLILHVDSPDHELRKKQSTVVIDDVIPLPAKG